MGRHTKEQRVFIGEQHFKNNERLAAFTVHNFCIKYDWNSDLTLSTVKRLIQKIQGDWIN